MADQFHIGPICPTKRHHKVTTILNNTGEIRQRENKTAKKSGEN